MLVLGDLTAKDLGRVVQLLDKELVPRAGAQTKLRDAAASFAIITKNTDRPF